MNPKLLLEKFQALEASGAVKDLEDAELQRYEAACSQVGQRMKDSLREAASAGHAAKQKALLQFAKDVDRSCGRHTCINDENGLIEVVDTACAWNLDVFSQVSKHAQEFDEASGGSLEAELQAVLDGAV